MTQETETEFDVQYFVRTDSLRREGRVSRMLTMLSDKGLRCQIVGVVKSKDGFESSYYEYKCLSDRVKPLYLKVAVKLLEIQVFAIWYFLFHSRKTKLIILANHEFLFSALLLSVFTKKTVYVDLHEHYFASLFGRRKFAEFLFFKCFSGVVFANSMRARDFLGEKSNDPRVSVLRNFPDIAEGTVQAPQLTIDSKLVVGIVNGRTDERFGAAIIRALDMPEFSKSVRIETFGSDIDASTSHIDLKQNGRYHHADILEHLTTVDVSMVFYDPERSLNNLFCEPNRFFEGYNSGKIVYVFKHPSLEEFYDEYCRLIDKQNFVRDIRAAVSNDIELKSDRAAKTAERKLLTYRESAKGIETMIAGIPRTSSAGQRQG